MKYRDTRRIRQGKAPRKRAVAEAKMQTDAVPENKMQAQPGEDKAYTDLWVPSFASGRAKELADELGIPALQFMGRKYSGVDGFTAADVRAIADELKERDE